MASNRFHGFRRFAQLAALLLIALIPGLGVLKIDLASASFHVLDRQIWWSSFSFIFGLVTVAATATIITYVTVGTAWCGWGCPQNLLSEWANKLTYKFLGKRADVRVDGKGMTIAAAKNKPLNWLILGTIFLAAALILAIIPVLFFFPSSEVLAFVTFSAHGKTSSFLQFLYFITALLILIDIAVVRYFLCDYICLYRLGQLIFKNRDALHVSYDASRASACSKCNYCATSCITNIQPTDIKIYDRCIGCGECIDACNLLHGQSGEKGLLYFEIGKKGSDTTRQQKFSRKSSHFIWATGSFFILGCMMMVWGVVMQEPIQSKASLEAQLKTQQIARVCDRQCATLQSPCNGKHMEGCFIAAACKCECSLQQDPANALSNSWRQCVQVNTAHADALSSGKVISQPAKP